MADELVRAEADADAMTLEHVSGLWDAFRSGRPVICTRDEVAMAVSVDSTIGAYRLVCVACGHATPWFESKPGQGIRLRGLSSRPPPAGTRDR
jgi:hypothetical protein